MADAHVVSLSESMAQALRDKPIDNRGDRIRAYWEAGIIPAWSPDDVWQKADAIAEATELSRRLTQ